MYTKTKKIKDFLLEITGNCLAITENSVKCNKTLKNSQKLRGGREREKRLKTKNNNQKKIDA